MTKDRLKEEIGWFKLLVTIASAIFTSIASWFWNNYQTASVPIAVIVVGALVIFATITFFLFSKIYQKIKELDYYDDILR